MSIVAAAEIGQQLSFEAQVNNLCATTEPATTRHPRDGAVAFLLLSRSDGNLKFDQHDFAQRGIASRNDLTVKTIIGRTIGHSGSVVWRPLPT